MRQQLLLAAAPGRSQRQEVAIKHIYSQRGPFLLPSSARLIYIQHNESGERRATRGEKEMMGLRERGVKKKRRRMRRESRSRMVKQITQHWWAHLFFHEEHTNMQQHHHNPIKTDRLRSPLNDVVRYFALN